MWCTKSRSDKKDLSPLQIGLGRRRRLVAVRYCALHMAVRRDGKSEQLIKNKCNVLGSLNSFRLQLNLHETDLFYRYPSHHLTWHCSTISEDLHRFARNLQHLSANLFLLLFLNNFTTETIRKTILGANAANFLQICVNLQKYWKALEYTIFFCLVFIQL